jgi:hypothetical protein
MRHTLFVISAWMLVGCSSGGGTGSTMGPHQTGPDMAIAAVPDMAVGADMEKTLNGCKGLFTCVEPCANASDPNACEMACVSGATHKAFQELQSLGVCVESACLFGADGGAGHCKSYTDQSQECSACQQLALGGANSPAGPCADPNDPACGACTGKLETCLNDGP